MTPTPQRRLPAAAAAALVALAAGACSSAEEPAPDVDQGPSLAEPSAAPTLEIEPVVRTGEVVGRIARPDRARVVDAVAGVTVRYLRAAFLDGDYPRSGGFGEAFEVFTPGAAKVARTDLGLVTNADIGERVEDVSPASVDVSVDVLAVAGRASAATSHLTLAFRTTGGAEKRVRVQGRLSMTKEDGRWRVFAYDLTKGAR